MKQIKGKKYYVSLGYIEDEKITNGVNDKDIQSIFTGLKGSNVLYIDDTDKENIVSIPLIQVNEIQKKKNIFKFRVIVDPFKMLFDDDSSHINKINIIGLFSEYVEDGVEYIEHVSFFNCDQIFDKNGKPITFSIEVESDKILGDK